MCFAAQECDAALFLFEKLFDSFQFILSRTKADLFRLIKGCLPFNIRVGIFEMIVVAVPSRLCKVLAKLAVSIGVVFRQASAHAWSRATGSKLANIPISGRIGASFSPWQSQFGLISCTREIWKHGRP